MCRECGLSPANFPGKRRGAHGRHAGQEGELVAATVLRTLQVRAAYGLSPVKRKCSVVTCLLSREAKTAVTSLIPLALKVWSRSPAVRKVKNCFLGALKSNTFLL